MRNQYLMPTSRSGLGLFTVVFGSACEHQHSPSNTTVSEGGAGRGGSTADPVRDQTSGAIVSVKQVLGSVGGSLSSAGSHGSPGVGASAGIAGVAGAPSSGGVVGLPLDTGSGVFSAVGPVLVEFRGRAASRELPEFFLSCSVVPEAVEVAALEDWAATADSEERLQRLLSGTGGQVAYPIRACTPPTDGSCLPPACGRGATVCVS